MLSLTIIAAIAGIYFFLHFRKEKSLQEIKSAPLAKVQLEEPKPAEDISQPEEIQPAEKEKPAPETPEKHLFEMPFYSQAPFSKWDAFHEDMCEEASVLNAAYYLLGKRPSKEAYENELQAMQKTEKKEIGEWKSTTVAETKRLIDVYFGGKVKSRIIDNPSIENIESEIAAGRPVVVPLAGRDIGNPNFTPPGPVYHMLTIKGYDAKNFITNDVGTRKGNSYAYEKEVIMKNIHDWDEVDIHLGVKRVLVLQK